MSDQITTVPTDWFSDKAATFGDRVSGAREALGLSQSDLAARLGVKLKTLRDWEDDLNDPRSNKLQMLSGVLNVSITWLLNGEGDGVDISGDGNGVTEDVLAILGEMRALRGEMSELSVRLGALEARLRSTLRK